jgi:hypothetical protein
MVDKNNLDGQKLQAALDEFADIGLGQNKSRLEETTTMKRNVLHVGRYFNAPMLPLIFLMKCRS